MEDIFKIILLVALNILAPVLAIAGLIWGPSSYAAAGR